MLHSRKANAAYLMRQLAAYLKFRRIAPIAAAVADFSARWPLVSEVARYNLRGSYQESSVLWQESDYRARPSPHWHQR